MGGGASGAHSSYTGVQALKVESGEGMSGEDRDFYGDAAVDLKFGSVATDASVPTGLASVDSKDSKMKEQDMDKKSKKDEIKTFEGTEEDGAGELNKQSSYVQRQQCSISLITNNTINERRRGR